MARPRRRLTVIAALDVVGYSELIQADEMGTLREMRSIYRHLVRPSLPKYSAHIIKTMGDGGLVEFPSVLDAVEWTMAFQTAMAARNAARGGRPAVQIRAAIALADVILSEDDRFGAAIGFAMRLQEAAPAGGIAITHSVRWQLIGEIAIAFRPAGFLTLRSVPYPVDCWFWAPEGVYLPEYEPTPTQMQTPGILDLPHLRAERQQDHRPLLVVLPFDNLSADPAVEPIADGVVEEATATLSRVREVRVVARNSAFLYKGRPTDVRTLVEELGVGYVVEGSVRKAAERLRVTAQLIDAETGAHLWSGRADGDMRDPFKLQDDVATLVAGALHPAIRAAEIRRAQRKPGHKLKVGDLVLRALPSFWTHRREDNLAAIGLLDEALAIEPRHAAALGLKAWSLSQQVTYLWSANPEADRETALELADRAAEIGEPDPLVFTAIGATLSILHTDQSRALAFIERAIALDTTFAWAWTRSGYAKAYSGRPQEGLEDLETAIALSPDDPVQFNAFAGVATCHFLLGRHAEGARWALRALDGRPGMVWANRLLATCAAHAGEMDLAARAVERLQAAHPGLTIRDVVAGVHNLAGPDLDRYIAGLRLAGLPE